MLNTFHMYSTRVKSFRCMGTCHFDHRHVLYHIYDKW